MALRCASAARTDNVRSPVDIVAADAMLPESPTPLFVGGVVVEASSRGGSADRQDSPASPAVVGAVEMLRRVVGRADDETGSRADELEIRPAEISAAG